MKIYNIFLLLLCFLGDRVIFAGKEAETLAKKDSAREIIKFSCYDSFGKGDGSSKIVVYRENNKILPIFVTRGGAYKIVKDLTSLTSYDSIYSKRLAEGQVICTQILSAASIIVLSMLAGKYYPQYSKSIVQEIYSRPMIWGLTLPPALYVNIEDYNPWVKWKQAEIIKTMINCPAEPVVSCNDPDKYIYELRTALGITASVRPVLSPKHRE